MLHPKLTWQQHELLALLAKGRLKPWMQKRIEQRCGSVDSHQRLFIELGLTRPPETSELLAEKFKVPELKALLKDRGQPTSGRKHVLARRLVESSTDDSIRALIADVEMTCLTARGEKLLDDFDSHRSTTNSQLESDAFSFLMNGDLPGAAKVVLRTAKRELLPHSSEGAVLGSLTIDSRLNVTTSDAHESVPLFGYDIASRLFRQHHRELPQHSQDYRRQVAAMLSLSALLGLTGFEPARRIMGLTGGDFRCEPLERFMRDHSKHGRPGEYDPDSPESVADIYVRTKLAEAYAERNIENIFLTRQWSRGIRISTINDHHCPLCHLQKSHYTWDEITELPRLPRHWGCRCSYTTWSNFERAQ